MVRAAGTILQAGMVKRSATTAVAPLTSVQYLAELAGVAPGDRVLDAGCGVGGPAIAIASNVPGVVIDGVTISEVQVTMARTFVTEAGLADRVRVHLGDFHRLPFPDESFDVALYFEVTCYSPDRAALYRESARVLKPLGTVYVKDVFRQEDPLTEQQGRSLASYDELWACTSTPTLSETEEAMRAAGFTSIHVREYPFIDTAHHYESMVSRDEGGVRLNEFGEAFLRFFPKLPLFFAEVKARKQGN
ncbi:MAG TPA: methyltransferase domain-containing protein [Blastococcus sp.]|nr:methyltransferase domain-containing protein [Blastococcus sp.]